MALRALLFSKNPETADSLAGILGEAGIRAEICADIFRAIERGTKEAFSCIIADWSDQPESGFLLKRAHESEPNRRTVTIAIVEGEPTAEQVRDSRLDFMIYRPIAADEARAVLAKARQQMQMQPNGLAVDLRTALVDPNNGNWSADSGDPNLVSMAADLPEQSTGGNRSSTSEPEERIVEEEPPAVNELTFGQFEPRKARSAFDFRVACAAALVVAAALCLWRSRESFLYLARTPEGTVHVLKQSVAALFYANRSGAPSVGSAMTDSQQDAYFSRNPGNSANVQPAEVGVVNGEITLPEISRPLPKAFDLPLPTPQFVRAALPPLRTNYAKVPDSLKNSAPISGPVVVTVNPALVPVSSPAPTAPISQASEPVPLSEEAARALAVHVVDPVYPPQALAQKLHGLVVLQAVIGRDGSVQELKIERGYFLLGRAAIAAVKQWRFQPYTVNGHPVAIQTQITVSFSYPPA